MHFSNQCNKKPIQNFWTNYTPGNSLVKCVLCSITKTFLSRGLQYKLTVQQFVGGILKKLWRFMTCVRTQYRGYEFLLLGGTSFPCNCRCMEIIVPCDWYFGIAFSEIKERLFWYFPCGILNARPYPMSKVSPYTPNKNNNNHNLNMLNRPSKGHMFTSSRKINK